MPSKIIPAPLLAILWFAMTGLLAAETSPREVLSLDRSWRFHQGDIAFPIPKNHHQTYSLAKAGNANGPAAAGFDDTGWRELDLPHDWVVEGPFDAAENCPQGYRPRGIGFYRRHFKLDAADEGKHLELQFDGIATHATVWFNGTLVARNFCGYTSFQADVTPLAAKTSTPSPYAWTPTRWKAGGMRAVGSIGTPGW
jgi:beta-galactosidase